MFPFFYGPVVQLVRTLACHARGHGFESHPGRHFLSVYASVAQLVEQRTENPRVVGSIPTGGTLRKKIAFHCGSDLFCFLQTKDTLTETGKIVIMAIELLI